MVNGAETTGVQLVGTGLKVKPNGNYLAGELREATNVMPTPEGGLRNRPGVMSVFNNRTGALSYINNARRIAGAVGEAPVFIETGLVRTNIPDEIFNSHSAAAYPETVVTGFPEGVSDATYHSEHSPEFYLYYNYNHYMISMLSSISYPAGNTSIFKTFVWNVSQDQSNVPSALYAKGLDPATDPHVIVAEEVFDTWIDTASGRDCGQVELKSAFIHKERMWILTTNSLYFSKATDPMTWAVPDGGFIRFHNQNLKFALSFKDTIYIFGDNAVWALNYSADPNDAGDAVLTNISENVGADHACAHDGAVYFVKNDFLYTINNSDVQRVVELGLNLPQDANNEFKLVSYRNIIYMIYRTVVYRKRLLRGDAFNSYVDTQKQYLPAGLPTTSDSNVFMMDMSTGFLGRLDFVDLKRPGDIAARWDDARICDAIVPQTESARYNTDLLYFMTNTEIDTDKTMGSMAYLDPREDAPLNFIDSVHTAGGLNNLTILETNPRVRLVIDSFVPDGNEYSVKKFRSYMTERKATDDCLLEITAAFDDMSFASGDLEPVQFSGISADSVADNPRFPVVARFPLNQRARSISFEFKQNNIVVEIGDSSIVLGDWPFVKNTGFELATLAVLWTPTGRGPKYRTLDSFNAFN